MSTYKIPHLPLTQDIETKAVLKKVVEARAALAELKGIHVTVPNVGILINTLALQEAKDSSAIENIITTHDELFRAELNLNLIKNIAAKEVQRYSLALKKGFEMVSKDKLIINAHILKMQQILEENDAGYRQVPGTELKNDKTNEVVYVPPQSISEIESYMTNLLAYINNDALDDKDYLIKMAIIHHQFESIHPFYDGNGRLGRILNIQYLVVKGLLDYPILYLSRYIVQNKAEYYHLLQSVRDNGNWEQWILFMLDAVINVSKQSIDLIKNMKKEMMRCKNIIRNQHSKIYSQDLLNNIFKHPYTKIDFLMDDLRVERRTAAKYLDILAEENILKKIKIGRVNYYINNGLMNLFLNFNYKL